MENPAWGLGFHQSTSPGLPAVNNAVSQVRHEQGMESDGPGRKKSYLQQCLSYHDQQETIRQSNPLDTMNEESSTARHAQRCSSQQTSLPPMLDASTSSNSADGYAASLSGNATTPTTSDETIDMHDKVQEARARAQAIFQRFQQQQEALLSQARVVTIDSVAADSGVTFNNGDLATTTSASATNDTPRAAISINSSDIPNPLNPAPSTPTPAPLTLYQKQRLLAKHRDYSRRQEALFKNLLYIQEKENLKRNKLAAEAQKAQDIEDLYEQARQYKLMRKQKKEQLQQEKHLQSMAGLGSKERKRVDKTHQTLMHHIQINASSGDNGRGNSNKKQHDETEAFYFSGLPKNKVHKDERLESLFRAYGNLRKVHYYRDKKTGRCKGDGLAIYNVASDNDRATLRETICLQVRDSWCLFVCLFVCCCCRDSFDNDLVCISCLDEPFLLYPTVCAHASTIYISHTIGIALQSTKLNGAELPGGIVLHVELATSSSQPVTPALSVPYQDATVEPSVSAMEVGLALTAAATDNPPVTSAVGSDDAADEDLDDFFQSLE
jgi:hypothetical protein